MQLTRRTFLGGAAAAACLREGFAATNADARIFSPNGGRAADFLMCRRLYLDICGRLPTRAEVEEYVASRDGKKYEKLVDALLESDDYADYWAMRYCDILRVKSEFPINLWPNAVYVYHRRIRQSIAADEPWPDFARALLSSRGSNFRVPEVNFLRAASERTPEGLSKAAAITFLMAPTEKYAKYFSRVAWKKTREWKEEIIYLDEGPADAVPEAFLEELQGPLAAKFYSTPVRRVLYWLYGGEQKKVVVDRWTREYQNKGCRLKALLRYAFTKSQEPDYRVAPGRFPARRLDAEVLDDALCSLTGSVRNFQSIAPEPYSFIPPARKSVLVEDGSIFSAFLILFGRPSRDTGMMEERNNQITAKQRLYLYNSSKLWRDLGEMTAKEDFKKLSHKDQVTDLYMRFLSRPPVKDELFFFDEKNKITARDVAWHLLNSREFLYRI